MDKQKIVDFPDLLIFYKKKESKIFKLFEGYIQYENMNLIEKINQEYILKDIFYNI